MQATPITILIVEDDQELQGLYKARFVQEGFQVLQAFDGERGLQILESTQPISLIILDIMLPRMSGYDVLAHLQKSGNTHPPVLVVSALAEYGSELASFKPGMVAYIEKGELKPSEIVEKVRQFALQAHVSDAGKAA